MSEYSHDNSFNAVSDDKLSLNDRLIKYIRDFDRWTYGDERSLSEVYEPNPMYVISAITDEDERKNFDKLSFDLEWNRGEIGLSQKEGNCAFERQILFINTILRRIHMVSFDGGKKYVVAPDWEPVGKGRFYHYLGDSLTYAYQCFCARKDGIDHSKGLRKRRSAGYFDIPVLKDEVELQRFVKFCRVDEQDFFTSDEEEQNELFYVLLDKYEEFKRQ